MSELLRVTQPTINRNQMVNPQGKPQTQPSIPFQVIDSHKVQTLSTQKQTTDQNNTILLKDSEQPTILMNMLQDPQATVQFLRTIYLLQEVVNMMPMIDNPLSAEIQELFQNLLLNPKDIVKELVKQEDASSYFRGELFDNLRNMLNEMAKLDLSNTDKANTNNTNLLVNNLVNTLNNSNVSISKSDMQLAFNVYNANGPFATQIKNDMVVLLKAINQVIAKDDILTSIGNNLSFLSNALKASTDLSESLKGLSEQFKNAQSGFDFEKSKSMIYNLVKQVEGSILFTPKIEKNASILMYNLSRYNEDESILHEATNNMLKYFTNEKDQQAFTKLVFAYIKDMGKLESRLSSSKVMNTLTMIIEKQIANSKLTNLDSSKIEKIIYSLLSSPSNFTPLLHFVIPVNFMDSKTFAEVWIDPILEEEDEKQKGEKGDKGMQVLVAFDVERLGRFESEIRIKDNKLNANIFVPPAYLEAFESIKDDIMRGILKSNYNLEDVNVLPLAKPRSLMEVFNKLPIKRSGLNVKV